MIGVFDSGVGGLTVVKEIYKAYPNCKIVYFGDTARLPYGTKGASFVKKYSRKIVKWLISHGADSIIIACNTSSAWAADSLRQEFKDIPILEMIGPAIEQACLYTKNKRIGIIGTPGTIRSGVYEKRLAKKGCRVFTKACPLFVPIVEEGLVSGNVVEEVAKRYLAPLRAKGIDVLILACTHYPLLKSTIQKIIGKEVRIVNPAEAVVKGIGFYKKGKSSFYFSDQPYNLQKISKLCFERKIKPIVNDPFNS